MRNLLAMLIACVCVIAVGACSYLKDLNCGDLAVLGTTAPMVMGMTPAAPLSPVMPLLGALYAENVCKAAVAVSVASAAATPTPAAVTAAPPAPK
jgi:hypothetical protein